MRSPEEQGSMDSSLARMVAGAPSVTLFSFSSGVLPAAKGCARKQWQELGGRHARCNCSALLQQVAG